MDLPVVGLLVVVAMRFVDAQALRGLDPEARGRVDAALLRARTIGFAMLVAGILAALAAWALSLPVSPTVVVFALLLASAVVQTLLGTLRLRRVAVPGRYKAVFVATRLGTIAGLALLVATPPA
ncbi:MAG: hypothetical protein ACK4YP_11740 [Myxococcota bacterium]